MDGIVEPVWVVNLRVLKGDERLGPCTLGDDRGAGTVERTGGADERMQ